MPYTLNATSCPAPQALGSAFYSRDYCVSTNPALPLQNSPAGYSGVSQGELGTKSSSQVNYSLAQLSQVAKYGGGGYAKVSGYDYGGASGLTVTVNAGIAMVDGPVESKTSQTIVVDDNANVWVWLKQNGTLTKSTSTSVPTGGKVALFRVTTSAGSVTANDQSGVVSIVNGCLERQTADAGAPGDSPSSSLRLYTHTASGIYFWDGTRHVRVGHTGRQSVTVTSGDVTLSKTQMMASVVEAAGSPGSAKNVVWPAAVDGACYVLYNNTGQSVTFKVSGQIGVTLTTGKRCQAYCDGTDIKQVTTAI